MVRRIAAILISMLTTLASLLATAPPTEAASRGPSAQRTHDCVDNSEWKMVQKGDTRGYIHNVFDIVGVQKWAHGKRERRLYAYCGHVFNRAAITYRYDGSAWRAIAGKRL